MYNEATIETLEKRIAWKQPVSDAFALTVDDDNLTGDSGKHFSSYHRLVDVEYIEKTLNDMYIDSEKLNAELSDIRKQAVLQVLSSVFDSNKCYLIDFDYSPGINARLGLFDDAIGYTVACAVLQLYVATRRSNLQEANAKLAIDNLKLELEGYNNGFTSSKGLLYSKYRAIRDVIKVFFPEEITVEPTSKFW